ncbi:hypothetical protein V6N13_072715 [Hibiscus sabdariffa]
MGSHKSRAILATGGEERESLSRVAEVDGQASFKYLFTWQSDPRFVIMLSEAWDGDMSLLSNIANFSSKASDWNVNKFGHIGKHKRRLLARIEGMEKMLEFSHRSYLVELESKLKRDLSSVLD